MEEIMLMVTALSLTLTPLNPAPEIKQKPSAIVTEEGEKKGIDPRLIPIPLLISDHPDKFVLHIRLPEEAHKTHYIIGVKGWAGAKDKSILPEPIRLSIDRPLNAEDFQEVTEVEMRGLKTENSQLIVCVYLLPREKREP